MPIWSSVAVVSAYWSRRPSSITQLIKLIQIVIALTSIQFVPCAWQRIELYSSFPPQQKLTMKLGFLVLGLSTNLADLYGA